MLLSSPGKCCLAKKFLQILKADKKCLSFPRCISLFSISLSSTWWGTTACGVRPPIGFSADDSFFACGKIFQGFPHSRPIWESISDRTQLITAVVKCKSIVQQLLWHYILEASQDISSCIKSPCISPPYLHMLTFYSSLVGSCVCIER